MSITYDVTDRGCWNASAVIQPVSYKYMLHVMIMQRAEGQPAAGGWCNPCGYNKNGQTNAETGSAEMDEEGGIYHPPKSLKYVAEEKVPPATEIKERPNDTQWRNITFWQAPLVHSSKVDLSYRGIDNETADLTFVRLSKDRKKLVNMHGQNIDLCFPLHQKHTLAYLQKNTPKTYVGRIIQSAAFAANHAWRGLGEKWRSSPQRSVPQPSAVQS